MNTTFPFDIHLPLGVRQVFGFEQVIKYETGMGRAAISDYYQEIVDIVFIQQAFFVFQSKLSNIVH